MQQRQRLTITLRGEVLNKLDNYIDGDRIRNRSHAIEYVLNKHLSPKVRKAVILAGGRGRKMIPFTYEMPKAMIPINDRPVLEYIIENLRRWDIRELIISIGHQGKKIERHFGDGSKFGVKITYVEQGKSEIGNAAPLLQLKKYIEDRPFILYYSDVLANIEIGDLIDFHLSGDALVTMAITTVQKSSDWGVVRMQGRKIRSFLEKPESRKDLSQLINAGVYVCDPKLLDHITSKTKKLEHDVFPKLVDQKKLAGYLFASPWFDVGDPDKYKEAVKKWKN